MNACLSFSQDLGHREFDYENREGGFESHDDGLEFGDGGEARETLKTVLADTFAV